MPHLQTIFASCVRPGDLLYTFGTASKPQPRRWFLVLRTQNLADFAKEMGYSIGGYPSVVFQNSDPSEAIVITTYKAFISNGRGDPCDFSFYHPWDEYVKTTIPSSPYFKPQRKQCIRSLATKEMYYPIFDHPKITLISVLR